jgi:iron-sulfur cluster assembly accessory protein
LRLAVEGGGCSGFRYDLSLDRAEADDVVWSDGDVEFRVDSVSVPFLVGSVLRFESDWASSRFIIDNPNVVSRCGCAMSFAV